MLSWHVSDCRIGVHQRTLFEVVDRHCRIDVNLLTAQVYRLGELVETGLCVEMLVVEELAPA